MAINDPYELDGFKRMNLVDFAARFYGFEIDKRKSSPVSTAMERGNDKIIVKIAADGHWTFFSVNDQGAHGRGGSILDFVMWQENIPNNIGKARQIIRGHSPSQLSFPTAPARPVPVVSASFDYTKFADKWAGMKHYPGYLSAQRGLKPDTIAKFRDHIRLDVYGNTVFCHRDERGITGWEAKNKNPQGGTWTGFAPGGKKALFACQVGEEEPPPNIVIAESAIDAMSYYQENQTPGLYLSFGGGISPSQKKLLADTLARYPAANVLIATDADGPDGPGEKYAAIIRSMRPDAQRKPPPVGKDWNDTVCATADFHPHVDTAERQVTPPGLGARRRGR
jgi:hypothetical protein